MWAAAEQAGLPVLVVVTGCDRDRSAFATTVESLVKLEKGATPVPLTLPIEEGSGFQGIVDVLHGTGTIGGKSADVPAGMADAVAAARERLAEAVAETDDTLLERYLEDGELSEDDLSRGLVAAVRAGRIAPVFATASLTSAGAAQVLRGLAELLPSPAERGARPGRSLAEDSEVSAEPDPEAPFSALVFKTTIDRYAGQLSVFRVVSGRIGGQTEHRVHFCR